MGESVWTHPNKEWQKTLDLARKLGWSSTKAESHGGLVLTCPGSNNPHKIRVYSTAKDTESVALGSRKRITRCEHLDLSEPLGRAETALGDAERLLQAATALVERSAAQGAMEEILSLASEQLAEAETAYDEAQQRFEEASGVVDDVMGAQGSLADPVELIGSASSHLRKAELTLRPLPPKDSTVARLGQQLRVLKSRRDGLHAKVGSQRGQQVRHT